MMTVEEFFDRYEAEHPLREECSMAEWIDRLAAVHKAYREYDPLGAAELDRKYPAPEMKHGPAFTMEEWASKRK